MRIRLKRFTARLRIEGKPTSGALVEMRKKIFYIIGSCAFLCIVFLGMQNCGIIPYRKTIRADYENNKLIFYKFRTAEMLGINLITEGNLSIFIESANCKTKYRIFNNYEKKIMLTNSKNIFFDELIKLCKQYDENTIYILNIVCTVNNTVGDFLSIIDTCNDIKKLSSHTVCQRDNYRTKNYIIKFNNYDRNIDCICVDYCICGSDAWNNYTDEKKLKNILRRKFSVFYY